MIKKIVFVWVMAFLSQFAMAQVAKQQVLFLQVSTNANGSISINWPNEAWQGTYQVYKKSLDGLDWAAPIATLNGSTTSYTDENFKMGEAYDYLVAKVSGNNASALGYVYAGNKTKLQPTDGELILLIDSAYINALSFEINRLIDDLGSEGRKTHLLYAGRNETPTAVKERIIDLYDKNEAIQTLFILGHVPVPYSGDFSQNSIPPPDGHVEGSGNHTGAWAADAYYGDMDFTWLDVSVNNTSGNREKNRNIPNDGKFDHSKIPSEIELEVGRVDLYDLPLFNLTDTLLTKNYLDRNHAWRTGQVTTVNRAVLDNNFGNFNIASTGYHNFSTFMPHDQIFDNLDYLTELKDKDYLWSYGCGAGSYTSCSGVAKTQDFADYELKNVFTIMAGSFFGDWDISNNLLRAPLANSALFNFWGGIPKWYIHHMALGKSIGYGTRLSVNNELLWFNGQFNSSFKGIHIALMGDPTLKLHPLPSVTELEAISSKGKVELNWDAASGTFDGYMVCRINNKDNSYEWLTDEPIAANSFIDNQNWISGNYSYRVFASTLVNNPSGSYYAIGGCYAKADGTDKKFDATVDHINSVSHLAPIQAHLFPNPSAATSQLELNNPNGITKVHIKNINGQLLYSENLANGIHTLPTADWTKGIYIIELHKSNGSTQMLRMVKL